MLWRPSVQTGHNLQITNVYALEETNTTKICSDAAKAKHAQQTWQDPPPNMSNNSINFL